jgi:hypothetical protein
MSLYGYHSPSIRFPLKGTRKIEVVEDQIGLQVVEDHIGNQQEVLKLSKDNLESIPKQNIGYLLANGCKCLII